MTEEKTTEINLTHENEKKKEYLKSYKNLSNKLESLEEQLESLMETYKSAKSQNLSGMPKGNNQTDLSDLMVEIEALELKVKRAKSKSLKRKCEIESKITDMENGMESRILHKKYIEFKKWEEICVEINYSWRQTHYIHSSALSNFIIA